MSEQRALLEARLAENPASPLFIRLAFLHLEEGRVEEALKLGLEGRKRFPQYVTGSLLLGKCFQTMGNTLEALLEYRKALQGLPENPVLRALLSEMEIRRLSDFRVFDEEKRKTLLNEDKHRSLEEFLSGNAPTAQPPKEPSGGAGEPAGRPEPAPEGSSRIITPTLAEIYASQGEFTEAISAYRRLMERRPDDANRFSARVKELEELAKRQEAGGESREEES